MRAALIVFTVAVLAHLPALTGEFVRDDVDAIVRDARLEGSILDVFRQGYWSDAGARACGDLFYRPATRLSFAVERRLSHGPALPRAVNVLLHATGSVLLLELLRRHVPRRAAVLGALAFAAHPGHAEAVAEVVGRSELLALDAGLAALLVPAGWVGPVFLVALGSKESAVAFLPFAVAARVERSRIVDMLLACAAYAIARALVLGWEVRANPGVLGGVPPLGVLSVVLRSVRLGVREVLGFGVLPPMWVGPPPGHALAGLAVVAACLLAAARGDRTTRLGLLGFFAALLPVSGLLPIGTFFAQRLAYAPSAWACFAAASSLRRCPRWLAAVVLGVATFLSATRDRMWRDDTTLLQASIRRVDPTVLRHGRSAAPVW